MEEIKLDLKPTMRRVAIPAKKDALSSFAGDYGSLFKGHGLEFTGFRAYTLNDDAHMIDWKASLRSNSLLIREFTEERDLNVFFLMDVSDSMLCSSIDKLKCEYAAELVASLSLAALYSGDNVGMAMFNDRIIKTVPIAGGYGQYYTIAKTLSNPHLYGGGSNLERSIGYALQYLRRNSVLVIVSDFLGLSQGWIKAIKIASIKYSLFGFCVRDKIDRELPNDSGIVLFQDPFSEERKAILPNRARDEYKAQASAQLAEVRDIFLHSGSNFLELSTDEPFAGPITKFFVEKSKRWR